MKNKLRFLILASIAAFLLQAIPTKAEETIIQDKNINVEKEQTEKKQDDITRIIKSGIEENQYLALDKCIKVAIANNPRIRAAISNTEVFKNRVGKAKSDYFPRFNINNGYSIDNQATFANLFDLDVNSFNIVNIGISQLLFDFGKTGTKIDIQKTNLNAEKAALKATINNIVFDVKKSYFNLLLAFHKQDVLKESVEQYKQLLEQAKAFYEVGSKPKIDVLTAEVNFSNAKLDLIRAENNVEIAFANLNNTMGLPESPVYRLKDKLRHVEETFQFKELIKKSYENRPDFKSAVLRVEASQKEIKLAKKDYFPTLEGFSGFRITAFDTELDSNIDEGWNAGINLDLPVLNPYNIHKKIKEAKASYEKETSEAQALKNDLYFQVKQAYTSFIEAQSTIPAAKAALEQAKETYELAKGRYEVGVGNPIELKDAELTYRNSKFAYYEALYDYNTAVAGIENVTGAWLAEY